MGQPDVGAFFGSIVSWLLGFIFKKPPPASRLEVQADRAAVAETKLTTVSQTAQVQTAIAKAEADAPADVAGVVKALNEGTF